MAVLTAEQQAILDKLKVMNSLPGTIAWGSEADVGLMAGGFAGSRTQETAARRAYALFLSMGGQVELDRLRAAVMSDPILNAEWGRVIAEGNRGDWFSRIGDTVVSAVPLALTVAAMAAGADLFMGGTLFTAPAAGTTAAAASGSSAATAGASTATQAAAASAYNPIAAMTGAGVGVSDAAVAAAAASAPGVASAAAATAEMAAAQWGTLATGAGQAASAGFSLIDAARNLPINKGQGAQVGTIFDGLNGTIQQVADAVVQTYSAVQGVQLQRAQIDLATAQARAASQPTIFPGVTSSGGVNWTLIGLGSAALLGVLLLVLRAK